MSKHNKSSVTAAVRVLRQKRAVFSEHVYDYEEKGGTRQGAEALDLDEHQVIKTLVMEDERKQPLLVLMHGDRQVSTQRLARFLGAKAINPCPPEVANKHTGYQVGGISPFGTRKAMPIYLETEIMALPYLYVNGGKRGFLVGMNPRELQRLLQPILVEVAVDL